MTLHSVIKLSGVVWTIRHRTPKMLSLKHGPCKAQFFPESKKLVFRHVTSGKYISKRV